MNLVITDYGASKEQSPRNNAKAIQTCIDVVHQAGGGTVTVPSGTFVSGTIYLRSHVELHIEHGGVLKASTDLSDYNALNEYPENASCAPEEWVGKHFIIANRADDVSITGTGTIDGSGESFFCEALKLNWVGAWRDGLRWSQYVPVSPDMEAEKETLKDFHFSEDGKKIKARPGQLIVFILSCNIRVADVAIRNSPCWSIFFHGCENVHIRGLRVNNGIADANTDGMDIDCCKNVTVSDCIIDTGDDSIAVRGAERRLPYAKPCENIVIQNCILSASSAGVRIGVGTGTVKNVELGNLIFTHSGTGVLIQSSYVKGVSHGVDISSVLIHHCSFKDTGCMFWISPGDADAISSIRGITIDTCTFEGFDAGYIIGNGERRPQKILMNNCEFFRTKSPDPERFYFNQNILNIEGADDVTFRQCRIYADPDEANTLHAVYVQDADNFQTDTDLTIEVSRAGKLS